MHARSVLDSFAFVGCAQHDRFKHAHFVLDSFAFVGCVLHDRFLCICLHSWHPLLSQVCDFAPAAGCFQSAAMVLVSEHVHPCSLDFWNQRRVVLGVGSRRISSRRRKEAAEEETERKKKKKKEKETKKKEKKAKEQKKKRAKKNNHKNSAVIKV